MQTFSLDLDEKSWQGNVFICLAISMVAAFFASPFLAIAALIRISLNSTLKGRSSAIFVLASVSIVWVIAAGAGNVASRSIAYRVVCSSNLAQLGKAMLQYANDHDEMLPEAHNWCDALIVGGYATPEMFICKDSGMHIGESSYVMNKAAAGQSTSTPAELVVLFETDLGASPERTGRLSDRSFTNLSKYKNLRNKKVHKHLWNQTGGPELLSFWNHKGDGGNVLFADSHVCFESKYNFPELMWVLDQPDFVYPAHLLRPKPADSGLKWCFASLYSIFGLLTIACGIIVLFCRHAINLKIMFILCLCAAPLGALFGLMGQAAYPSGYDFLMGGALSGVIVASLLAIAFVPLILKMNNSFAPHNFKLFSTTVGIMTGILCSTLVHLILMISCAKPDPVGIIMGIPFGIACGALLGYLTAILSNSKMSRIS